MSLTIGEIARSAGVPVDAVRSYAAQGLLPVPESEAAGESLYAPATVGVVRAIAALVAADFTPDQIRGVLPARGSLTGLDQVTRVTMAVEEAIASVLAKRDALDTALGVLDGMREELSGFRGSGGSDAFDVDWSADDVDPLA